MMGFFNLFISSEEKEDFWGSYKANYPDNAIAIERMAKENFSLLSSRDAKEKVGSFQRLARNNECQISQVKEVFLESFFIEFGNDKDVINQVIRAITQKIREEAIRYNISKSNTASFYIKKWLIELL